MHTSMTWEFSRIQVGPDVEGMVDYCLTSTVMLSMTTEHETSGTFSLSGSIRRQVIIIRLQVSIHELCLQKSCDYQEKRKNHK